MAVKKPIILLLLKLLETKTDENEVRTQGQLADMISEIYPCDRKTVCRNIQVLIDMKYPIVKTKKGIYLDSKKFTVKEQEFILNAITTAIPCEGINQEDLADRLTGVLTKIYREDKE